jgi:WD40 repeat protein
MLFSIRVRCSLACGFVLVYACIAQVYKTPSNLHTASVNSIAFAPHELGLVLACASSDGTVSLLEHKPDGSWDTSKVRGDLVCDWAAVVTVVGAQHVP